MNVPFLKTIYENSVDDSAIDQGLKKKTKAACMNEDAEQETSFGLCIFCTATTHF
jgi:hypothetical protein